MGKLSKAELTGPPHERGVEHGETFASEIGSNVSFYEEYFLSHDISPQQSREIAGEAIAYVETINPDFVAEMRGVAEGSGHPLPEIGMINFRHTIGYGSLGANQDDALQLSSDGCTSFAVQPERTANNHTLIGQNWDWKSAVELFLMEVQQEDAPNFLALTEAGMVSGKFGFNAEGVGFVVNGLSTPNDGVHPDRKPSHVRGREILDATRLDEALAPIISTDRPTSRNYMLAHENGEMVDIETTPDRFQFLSPEDHLLTHTNHFNHRIGIDSQLEKQSPHSVVRQLRIDRLFEKRDDELDIDSIQEILRDDFGYPKSISRHDTTADRTKDAQTNASVIMDLTSKRMYATRGPPDENEYYTYNLST